MAAIVIDGEARGLALTNRGLNQVAALCPDGDIERFDNIFKDGIDIDALAGLVAVLSWCYEQREMHKSGKAYRKPLTADEILDLDMGTLNDIGPALMETVSSSMSTTMRVKPKKEDATEPTSQSLV